MKVITLALWARHPQIEVAVHDLLRPLPAMNLVKQASLGVPPAMPDCPTLPNPIQIIVLARDPCTEAFLREALHAVPRLICVHKQRSHPDAVLMEHPLLTLCEQRVLRACVMHDRLREVADDLCLTEATIKKHLSRIYRKLGRHSLHRALL